MCVYAEASWSSERPRSRVGRRHVHTGPTFMLVNGRMCPLSRSERAERERDRAVAGDQVGTRTT